MHVTPSRPIGVLRNARFIRAFTRRSVLLCALVIGGLLETRSASGAAELRLLPIEGNKSEDAIYPVKFVVDNLPTGTALQFDIEWNPSLVSGITPSLSSQASTHIMDSASLGENQLRVLVYSLANAAISVEGLLTLDGIIANDITTEFQPFEISNVLLSNADSQSVDIEGKTLAFFAPRSFKGVFGHAKIDVNLNWNGLDNAIGYDIFRASTDDYSQASLIGVPTESTFLDDFVGGNTRYYYWIATRYPDGRSSISSIHEVVPVPSQPTQFSITSVTHPEDASLAWVIEDTPDTVEVLRSVGNNIYGAEKLADLNPTQLSFTDTSAISGIPYYYWIRSVNEFGTSPATSQQGLVSIAQVFEKTQLQAVLLSNGFSLQWSSAEGNEYMIAYSNDMKTWQLLPNIVSGNGTDLLWNQLDESNIDYPAYFQVFAVEQ